MKRDQWIGRGWESIFPLGSSSDEANPWAEQPREFLCTMIEICLSALGIRFVLLLENTLRFQQPQALSPAVRAAVTTVRK